MLTLLLLLLACDPDADGDGYPASADCDDGDPDVSPEGVEYCNAVDDDCDGQVDEPESIDADAWYVDADEDGYGDAARAVKSCGEPIGFVADATDCDDSDPSASPAQAEVPGNGKDDDCDGLAE